jgi:proline racemase
VGVITAALNPDGSVSVANVPSYRQAKAIAVNVPGVGTVTGDVAWGGNWFFLAKEPSWPLEWSRVEDLTAVAWQIRQAVNAGGFPEVDHVELFGPPRGQDGHSRSFVLCPGKAYDRSPCGTGTCAKLACLAADGELAENQPWIQESIIGSSFQGSFRWLDRDAGTIIPTISGTAFITAEATLLLEERDPFCWGIH